MRTARLEPIRDQPDFTGKGGGKAGGVAVGTVSAGVVGWFICCFPIDLIKRRTSAVEREFVDGRIRSALHESEIYLRGLSKRKAMFRYADVLQIEFAQHRRQRRPVLARTIVDAVAFIGELRVAIKVEAGLSHPLMVNALEAVVPAGPCPPVNPNDQQAENRRGNRNGTPSPTGEQC
jgi:hypothetical protein